MAFDAGYGLINLLFSRWNSLHAFQDLEEAMPLFREVANDRSGGGILSH